MAGFNYSKYVADMAQRKGPMHETHDNIYNDANQLDNSYLDQLSLSTDINEDNINEYEVVYVVENGKCYRITDEGYKDQVDMSKCRMYAEAKVEEAFDLDATFKTSPSSHSYEDVLDIFTSYEDDNILNAFKAKFPEGKDINKLDYLKFAMNYIDDMSASSDIKANWISVTDPNVYKKAGLVEAIDDTDVEVTDDEFDSAEFDKEPSKKDIKAAEKEFSLEVPKADSSADSAFEKAKQIIKIKVGKLLAQPKGKRTASPDMAALKQFIQKPEIKKAFKSRGLDVMDFVKDVIA